MVYGLVTWRKNNALSHWKEEEKEKRWKKEKRHETSWLLSVKEEKRLKGIIICLMAS